MILDDTILVLSIGCLLGAFVCAGMLYRHNYPESFQAGVRRVVNLILGLLSYPVVLVCLTVQFALLLVATLCNYTFRRISGEPTPKVTIKVTFE